MTKTQHALETVINFFRFSQRFGIVGGLPAYIQWKLKRTKIHFPGLKYPIHMRPNSSDSPTFGQVFVSNGYDITFPFEPKTIIDAGANIGLFTVLYKKRFPEATVICLEPDPENFSMLTQNLTNYKNVHLHNAGLWNATCKLTVEDKYNLGKWGMVVREDENGPIEALSIGGIMEMYKLETIDIVKIDIESSEKWVFSNHAANWLPKVKVLILELHDFMEPGCASALFQALHQYMPDFRFAQKGENTIIYNDSLINKK